MRCTCSCRCKSPLHRRLGSTGTVPFRSANFTRRSDIELLSCVCWPGQVVSRVHSCAPQICCIQGTPLLPAPCRTPQFFAIPGTGVARFDAYARRPRAQEPPLAAGLGSSPPPPPTHPPGQIGEGGGLGQCGDIHPHPGPALLRVGLVNVTSLRHHVEEVAGWDHDVVLVQETRLTKGGQRALRTLLRERGWNVFWGAPLESRGGGDVGCLTRGSGHPGPRSAHG